MFNANIFSSSKPSVRSVKVLARFMIKDYFAVPLVKKLRVIMPSQLIVCSIFASTRGIPFNFRQPSEFRMTAIYENHAGLPLSLGTLFTNLG
ncbi:hypothetical protein CEXT_550511 [Caerostris extrusa]|uniref:Uncharacterized protein n=1 Tax=Caerostris extrusa TaxID=172846 RepID=A0AAV4TIR7_CAEEX|nr:hypothetical protein CEXT_550511 [Caerostris extrusa]